MKVSSIKSRIIFDSRGYPTLEAECTLEKNKKGTAAIPSGASTGSKEALELRDGDKNHFSGKGVTKALSNFNDTISSAVTGKTFNDQRSFDEFLIDLDGTNNKSNLGANAILAASLSFAKASANYLGKEFYATLGASPSLPRPMMNILNGGAHADNTIEIQEFMIVPLKYGSFFECMEIGTDVFHKLKTILKTSGLSTNVGDEGGFAPNLKTSNQAIDFILDACEQSGYKTGVDIGIALDCAANEFFKDGKYFPEYGSNGLDIDELCKYYLKLTGQYPIISIEDPFEESDFEGWKKLTSMIGEKIQIVGDDLYVTNPSILKSGIKNKYSNAILIKPNQIGTLSETIDAITMAKQNSFGTVISHRSGETEDTSIAHIAAGTAAGQIKTGSLCRTDRMVKYNELLRIEEHI